MSFSLTKKTDYALVALTELAREFGDTQRPQSARQIAVKYGLPSPLLMNVLKELARAGFLVSHRGVHGGYCLNRAPAEISLREVVEVMQGPVAITVCADESEDSCSPCQAFERCPINLPMRQISSRLNSVLGEITLAEFANPGVSHNGNGVVS